MAQHPDLELELSTTDRKVDLLPRGVGLRAARGAVAESSLIARPLGELRQVNCASPAYLERYGEPRAGRPAPAPLVQYAAAPAYATPAGSTTTVHAMRTCPTQGVLTVNGVDAYAAACLAGLGMIQALSTACSRIWTRAP